MKKKVLFVATVIGHIRVFHLPFLKLFKDMGYETYVAAKCSKEEDFILDYVDHIINLSIERNPLKLNNFKAIKQLKKILNKEKFDIIHCHTPMGSVVARLAARKERKNGTRIIYTAHGFHFYKGAPIKNWLIYYPIEKIMAHYTDCLITITNEDYHFAQKHFKICNIEHINGIGMNIERFLTIDKDIVEKLKLDLHINENDIVFTYVAELNKNKNQALLIDTIDKLKKDYDNIKLLLVGDGPYREKYEHEIKNKDLQNKVMLLGRRKEIPEILSITDIYLASSLREGLPVNIMEAMYMGLPITASDNRGHRELIQNDNGFIVNKSKNFKKKIMELIENKELRKQMGKNSQEKVKKYELENVLEKMKQIYSQQIEERNL